MGRVVLADPQRRETDDSDHHRERDAHRVGPPALGQREPVAHHHLGDGDRDEQEIERHEQVACARTERDGDAQRRQDDHGGHGPLGVAPGEPGGGGEEHEAAEAGGAEQRQMVGESAGAAAVRAQRVEREHGQQGAADEQGAEDDSPSSGLAWDPDEPEASSLIKHSDERLYEAKNAGRNCVRG